MKKTFILFGKAKFEVDLDTSCDLAIPVKRDAPVNAYDLPDPEYQVFRTKGFTGSVKEGGTCNCEELSFVPHGNGTHTECIGHISVEPVWLSSCLKTFFFSSILISVEPETEAGEMKINRPLLEAALLPYSVKVDALMVRTLPNGETKLKKRYAGTNPPYFTPGAIQFLNEAGIRHLITDLPSVDHEEDKHLKAHHLFWGYPKQPERDKTITELAYMPDRAEDGYYLLNLQTPVMETDAAPSRPVIYPAELM